MTLQQAKDATAQKHVFESWFHVLSKRLYRLEEVDKLIDEAAELYASHVSDQLKEEVGELKLWKKQAIENQIPLIAAGQEDPLLKVGDSITQEAVKRFKEYPKLVEDNERLKAELDNYKLKKDI